MGPLRDLAAANAAAMRSSRSCAAGARRFPSPGSALHLGLEGRHQFARFAQVLLQARLSPKRAGPGRRTDPHPVLRYPLQADRPHRRQCRHVVRERFIHQRFVAGAKVVEGEVVHPHPATDPPIRVVLQTKPRHFAPAAHPLERGVEPQCKQDTRVDRHPTGIAAPRLDRLDQPAQVLSAPRSPTPIGRSDPGPTTTSGPRRAALPATDWAPEAAALLGDASRRSAPAPAAPALRSARAGLRTTPPQQPRHLDQLVWSCQSLASGLGS